VVASASARVWWWVVEDEEGDGEEGADFDCPDWSETIRREAG